MELSRADISRIACALDTKIDLLSRPIAGFSHVAQTIVSAEIAALEELSARLRGKPLTARQQRAHDRLEAMAAAQSYNHKES
jgi:hypothetical protein